MKMIFSRFRFYRLIISIHPTIKWSRRPTLLSLAIHHVFSKTPIPKLHFGTEEFSLIGGPRLPWGALD